MYKETNTRSIIKGVTWRLIATGTTVIIVYVFFGRLDLALAAGLLESVLKIALYWGHERIWHKVRWGRKQIEPFNLWFTGLPLSGKTTIANGVFEELQKLDIPIERIDAKDIRELIPDIGYSRDERNQHLRRVGHLVKTLQNNAISTVASFVSPYKESRKALRTMVKNNIVIYIKADIETCKQRDTSGLYAKAMNGEYKNFTGISDVYEEPEHAELIIDTDELTIEESVKVITEYVKKHYVK
jgi:adenylylsulfate kinase